jgi:TRAP-type C4-dicarboxylate transport system permease small subunit
MSDLPSRPPAPAPLPPELRYIKRLVTALTATMIAGLLAIVALLVIRLAAPAVPLPALPAGITLPAGAEIAALTFAEGFTVVVTRAGDVLLYGADGRLRQSLRP